MTVQDLIKALQALPKRHKKLEVGCLYDSNCAWTQITGIAGTHQDTGQGASGKWFIRLQGD